MIGTGEVFSPRAHAMSPTHGQSLVINPGRYRGLYPAKVLNFTINY